LLVNFFVATPSFRTWGGFFGGMPSLERFSWGGSYRGAGAVASAVRLDETR